MKSTKRMVLIPEDVLNRYEQRQRLESSPIMTNMMYADKKMSDILQQDDISDDEKQKLYNANMERYLELRRQKIVKFQPLVQPTLKKSNNNLNHYCRIQP